jgi:cardiolipin synthase
VHVVLRRRPVATSLAWLSIILFLPIGGLFFYLLIGEVRLGSIRAKKYERLTQGLRQSAYAILSRRSLEVRNLPDQFETIARFGKAVTGLPPLRGNRLRLLGDNAGTLKSLEADIAAAKHHIHMCYYIWAPDKAGTAIARALAEAVKRGVIVRVLADGAGSSALFKSPLAAEMKAAGIRLVEALPVSVLRVPFARIDLRNHRKIAVFDGKVAYCGSQNIIDVGYNSPRWKKAGRWVDATVRVQGPAAQELAGAFLRDWQLDSDEDITDCAPFLPEPELCCDDGKDGAAAQLIASGPGPTPQAIHQSLLTAFYAARREIVMTTPYFVPDAALLEAILAAATRGVKIAIVLPDVSDAPLVAAAGRAHYQELLDAGVELYEYLGGPRGAGRMGGGGSGSGSSGSMGAGEQGSALGRISGAGSVGDGESAPSLDGGSGGGSSGGLLHSKIMTMDGAFAMIGSTNMDQRSFFLNFEATLFVYDGPFAMELRKLQAGYAARSRRLDAEEWRKRSVWVRLRDNSAQLLGPLL